MAKLFLIPAPLDEKAALQLPAHAVETARRLDVFLCEKGKTARAFLKTLAPLKPFSEMAFAEIGQPTDIPEASVFFLEKIEKEGRDVGLLSEAGCPGVADPGAAIVALAHQKGIEVVPLVGPSSILLSLMASGMSGQKFCFHGYLAAKRHNLGDQLKKLETESEREEQTQIFIETPYRNGQMIEVLLASLRPETELCLAAEITSENEFIRTKTVAEWKKTPPPDLHKKPTIFLIFRRKMSGGKTRLN